MLIPNWLLRDKKHAVDENASACERAFFEPFRKMGVKDIRVVRRSIAVYLG